MTRNDFTYSLITGLTTGVITWRILVFLGAPAIAGWSTAWLVPTVPLAWLAGVQLGYLLGRWFRFFVQFGKYAAIGFTNAAVDFGVLYLLIAYSGRSSGVWFTMFKAVSFSVAIIHSYLWNKFWAFEARETSANGREFITFVSVALAALIVNVGVASFVVNGIGGPYFGLDDRAWAGFGAVVGSACSLIFSFLGFKFVVFKK